MNLAELLSKTEVELKNIKKDDIIEVITKEGLLYKRTRDEVAGLEKEKKDMGNQWNTISLMFAAFLGLEIEQDYYGNWTLGEKKINLVVLAGKILALKQ